MGTAPCKDLQIITNPSVHSPASDNIENEDPLDCGLVETSQFECQPSPLKNFIKNHSAENSRGASNGLSFQTTQPKSTPMNVKIESVKLVKPRSSLTMGNGLKGINKNSRPRASIANNLPRCSIDVVDIAQFQADLKDFVVTQKNMGDSFGRIQISQENFIQLRNEDIRKFYKFQKTIGQGAYGSVYKAICLSSGEVRAIKSIKKQSLMRGKKNEVFAQLQLLKKMDHPNIIKLYEVFEWENKYQVVMEFCDGGSFIDFIKSRNNYDEGVIRVILKQLLGCLNYLKTIRIVHRDLKLENVVFIKKFNDKMNTQQIQIKLLDFGTAYRMIKQKVKCLQLVGTVSYMPPEIIKGYFTDKCDLWSCGVIFYILLTSKSPFRCSKKQDTLQKILTHEIKFSDPHWQKVSTDAKDLLIQLLEKDPSRRISAADALRHPWFEKGQMQRSRQGRLSGTNILTDLASYYRQNNLISVLESYLVFAKVSQEERKKINSIFMELDQNLDGFIQKKELIQAFKTHCPDQFNQEQIQFILSKVDKDNSGCISLSEFTSAMVAKQKLWAKSALEEAFDYFDTDKTGYIERNELASLLVGSEIQQIEALLEEVDLDNDKRISKQQFIGYLLKQGCLY